MSTAIRAIGCSALISWSAHAADTAAPAASYSATGSFVQMLIGLAIVLVALFAFGWLMKRYAAPRVASGGAMRVVSTLALGQRERVVLIEVADSWVVVGVAPGRVSALHTTAKAQLPQPAAVPQPAAGFAAWLAHYTGKGS